MQLTSFDIITRAVVDTLMKNQAQGASVTNLSDLFTDLHLECIEEYKNAKEGDRSKLLNYFIKNKLQELMNSIGDF